MSHGATGVEYVAAPTPVNVPPTTSMHVVRVEASACRTARFPRAPPLSRCLAVRLTPSLSALAPSYQRPFLDELRLGCPAR